MKAAVALGILFLAVLVGGFYYNQVSTLHDTGTATSTVSTATTTTTTSVASGYSAAEIQTHNNAASCWTVIHGSVYDLTSWVSRHPGGIAAILMLCGRDGSSVFDSVHGRDPRAQSILATFKIGTYAS
jgi:cytochrome b involved in lipid metabolism